jgi:hypothetical protein
MKLQSAPRRKAGRLDKAGGDYLDLFRLLSHPAMTRPIAFSLREAPHDLGSWCLREITRRMLDDTDRTVGLIARLTESPINPGAVRGTVEGLERQPGIARQLRLVRNGRPPLSVK